METTKKKLTDHVLILIDLNHKFLNEDISEGKLMKNLIDLDCEVSFEQLRQEFKKYLDDINEDTGELKRPIANDLGVQHNNDSDESYCVDHKYNSWENSNLREDAIYFANKYCDKNAETREVLLTANKILGYMQDIKNQDDVELRRRAISLAESKNGDISKLLTIADMYYQYLKNGKIPEANYKR